MNKKYCILSKSHRIAISLTTIKYLCNECCKYHDSHIYFLCKYSISSVSIINTEIRHGANTPPQGVAWPYDFYICEYLVAIPFANGKGKHLNVVEEEEERLQPFENVWSPHPHWASVANYDLLLGGDPCPAVRSTMSTWWCLTEN